MQASVFVAGILALLAWNSTLALAQSGQKFVSTNPKPPPAAKPRVDENLGANIPVDIDQYVWKVKPPNTSESSVPAYYIEETGVRIYFGAVAAGTEIDTRYTKRLGSINYFCFQKPSAGTQKPSNTQSGNCVWVSGNFIAMAGKAAPATTAQP